MMYDCMYSIAITEVETDNWHHSELTQNIPYLTLLSDELRVVSYGVEYLSKTWQDCPLQQFCTGPLTYTDVQG